MPVQASADLWISSMVKARTVRSWEAGRPLAQLWARRYREGLPSLACPGMDVALATRQLPSEVLMPLLSDRSMLCKVRKAIFGVAAVIFVVTFFLDGMLANTFVGHPTSPDPATRRTVPYEVKRVHVYISQDELNLTYLFRGIEVTVA